MEAGNPKHKLVNIERNVNVVLEDDDELLEAAMDQEAF